MEDLSFHANEKLGGGINKWGLAALTETVLSKQVCFEFNFLINRVDTVFSLVQYSSEFLTPDGLMIGLGLNLLLLMFM